MLTLLLKVSKSETIAACVIAVLVAMILLIDHYLEMNARELSFAGQWDRWVEVLSGGSK